MSKKKYQFKYIGEEWEYDPKRRIFTKFSETFRPTKIFEKNPMWKKLYDTMMSIKQFYDKST